MKNTSKNQCMGCQAGWALTQTVFGNTVHMVQGGYPHEVVSCTRHRYDEACAECGHPESEHVETHNWIECSHNGWRCNCGNNVGR